MKNIILTGASGLVGSELQPALVHEGYVLKTLKSGRDWSWENGTLPLEALQGSEAIVHLAGENVGAGRWSKKRKALIRDSRVIGTSLLAKTVLQMDPLPKVFVSASAVGFYGERGDEVLTEDSAHGEGFLSGVCQEWEKASQELSGAGIRVVHLRIGMVLSKDGGALHRMLFPFKLGLGGVLGSGQQYMSWIHLKDLVSAIVFALKNKDLEGPVNGVAPNPVTNKEFTKAMGKVLSRPTIFPVPAIGVKTLMGEMGEALALASTRVEPVKLLDKGFKFQYPEIVEALQSLDL